MYRAMRGFFLVSLFLFSAVTPIDAGTISYTYDDAGRLIKAAYGNGKAIEYHYDNAGNLLSKKVTQTGGSGGGDGGRGVCFIETATSGSYVDPHAQRLNEPGDVSLGCDFLGRGFIRFRKSISRREQVAVPPGHRLPE